jgi:transcriptional regulator with XRE-family HTH domain
MDTPKAVDDLRKKLAAMSRSEVRALAAEAHLSASTVEKFRLGHIAEPRLSKLEALRAAFAARESSARKRKPAKVD